MSEFEETEATANVPARARRDPGQSRDGRRPSEDPERQRRPAATLDGPGRKRPDEPSHH